MATARDDNIGDAQPSETDAADSAAIMSSEADSPDEFLQPPIEGAAAQLVERLRKWRILDEHSQ